MSKLNQITEVLRSISEELDYKLHKPGVVEKHLNGLQETLGKEKARAQ